MNVLGIVPSKWTGARCRRVQKSILLLVVARASGGTLCNISFVLPSGKIIYAATSFVGNCRSMYCPMVTVRFFYYVSLCCQVQVC